MSALGKPLYAVDPFGVTLVHVDLLLRDEASKKWKLFAGAQKYYRALMVTETKWREEDSVFHLR